MIGIVAGRIKERTGRPWSSRSSARAARAKARGARSRRRPGRGDHRRQGQGSASRRRRARDGRGPDHRRDRLDEFASWLDAQLAPAVATRLGERASHSTVAGAGWAHAGTGRDPGQRRTVRRRLAGPRVAVGAVRLLGAELVGSDHVRRSPAGKMARASRHRLPQRRDRHGPGPAPVAPPAPVVARRAGPRSTNGAAATRPRCTSRMPRSLDRSSGPRLTGSAFGPHRLAVQDVALSRRKHGFDSRWGHQTRRLRSSADGRRQRVLRSTGRDRLRAPAAPASAVRRAARASRYGRRGSAAARRRALAARDRARDADELGPHLVAGEPNLRIAMPARIDEFEVRRESRGLETARARSRSKLLAYSRHERTPCLSSML